MVSRAADRKRMIAELQKAERPAGRGLPACERTSGCGCAGGPRLRADYPLLARGDLNLYSLFVERAMTLVKPDGMVGLLVPSGIASDKMAAPFFKSVATEGRLRALYDFENRRTRYDVPPFFPDVDSRFKFCAFVASPAPGNEPARCAFFLQDVSETGDPERCFPLSAADFDRVNPNTGTAPIFRSRRDAELTTAIYDRLPVLVDRSSGEEVKAWPVKYSTMFHMTNDSGLFRTRSELEEKEGAWPVGGNRFQSSVRRVGAALRGEDGAGVRPPGCKHRHQPGEPSPSGPTEDRPSLEQHRDPNWLPDPQYWVRASARRRLASSVSVGFWASRTITAPTNVRTFIAAL